MSKIKSYVITVLITLIITGGIYFATRPQPAHQVEAKQPTLEEQIKIKDEAVKKAQEEKARLEREAQASELEKKALELRKQNEESLKAQS